MTQTTEEKFRSSTVRTKSITSLKPVPEMFSSYEVINDLPTPERLPANAGFGSTLVVEADEFTRTTARVAQDIIPQPVAQLEKELWAAYRSALETGHVVHGSKQPQSAKDAVELGFPMLAPVPCLPNVSLPRTRNRPAHPVQEIPVEPPQSSHRPPEPVRHNIAREATPSETGSFVQVIPGQLFFLVIPSFKDPRLSATRNSYQYVTSMAHCAYDRSHTGLEPICMGQVVKFCHFLSAKFNREKNEKNPKPLVYLCKPKPKHCTSAAFLIATYLVLELGKSVEEAVKPFMELGDDLLRTFHNVTLQDCIRGMLKARSSLWMDRFDVAQYEALTDPSRGAITKVCPKFVAFRGPDAASELDSEAQLTSTARSLQGMGVQAVVRLNDAESYDTSSFSAVGIKHYDFSYEGYAVPPLSVVTSFLDVCNEHAGAIAVHCGLGGQGTLIALWMMRNHDFTANEAMGFVRVMRPGCVVGKQPRLLLQLEGATWLGNSPSLPARTEQSGSSSKLTETHSPNTESSYSSLSSSSSSLLAGIGDREPPSLPRQTSHRSFSGAEPLVI